MRRLFVIFYLLFLPFVTVADNGLRDGCVENGKYKKDFTIDKRCYVTDEQKQISPYNAVVRLTDRGCTGTIVKKDNGYFIYTAEHCTFSDNRDLNIKLQDGRTFVVNFVKKGEAVDAEDKFAGWAHYKMSVDKDDTSIPYAKTDSFKNGKTRIVGYGALEIMSDAKIKQMKEYYVEYLTMLGLWDDKEALQQRGAYILTEDGGIKGGNTLKAFLAGWVGNGDLKVSNCELSNGTLKGCQLWGGNSGGPLFNSQGGIMGIVSSGNYQLGGTEHATAGLIVGVYSDDKTNGRFGNWVASAGEGQTYYTSQKQYYERQEREAAEEMRQDAERRMQDAIRQNQQDRMDRFYLNQQNKQMMIKMAGQYQ